MGIGSFASRETKKSCFSKKIRIFIAAILKREIVICGSSDAYRKVDIAALETSQSKEQIIAAEPRYRRSPSTKSSEAYRLRTYNFTLHGPAVALETAISNGMR